MGDPRYKTNFFLRFVDKTIKSLYERHIINSAHYSIRLMVIFMFLIDTFIVSCSDCSNGLFGNLLVMCLACVSLAGTLKRCGLWSVCAQ